MVNWRQILAVVPASICSLILAWAYIEHVYIIAYLISRQLYSRSICVGLLSHYLWLSAVTSFAFIFIRGPGFASAETDIEKGQSQKLDEAPLLPSDNVETTLQDEDDMPLDRLASRASPYVGLMSKTQEREIIQEAEEEHLTVKANGERRFCRKCSIPKADRQHHCSMCNRCVLKMDHHCGVIGVCIGFANYKAFLLFLIYTCLFATYSSLLSAWTLKDFVDAMPDGFEMAPVGFAMLMILGGAIGLVLGGFTVFHLFLVARNKTTIENIESTRFRTSPAESQQAQLTSEQRRKLRRGAVKYHIYDLGMRDNIAAVFRAPTTLGWILPIHPASGDGRTFRVSQKNREKLKQLDEEVRQMRPESDEDVY